MAKCPSAVFRSEFNTCVFSKDLIIILEKTEDIDLDSIKHFLEKGQDSFQFGNCIQFLFDKKEILLRGYRLNGAWIASEISNQVHTLPMPNSLEEITTTLYYFYHMSTVV